MAAAVVFPELPDSDFGANRPQVAAKYLSADDVLAVRVAPLPVGLIELADLDLELRPSLASLPDEGSYGAGKVLEGLDSLPAGRRWLKMSPLP